MTLAEAEEVFGYWVEYPPTYQAVGVIAQMLGWKSTPQAPELSEIEAMAAKTGVAVVRGATGLPAAVVSRDEMRERNRTRMVDAARRNAQGGAR